MAESDAYLKWAAGNVDRLRSGGWTVSLVLLRSPTTPSPSQMGAAIDCSNVSVDEIERETLFSLGRRLRRSSPDALVLACTGPTVASIGLVLLGVRRRPVVVSGLPGVGLPVRDRALLARSRTDAFVAHSKRERAEYSARFGDLHLHTVVALARLPFLGAERETLRSADPGAHATVFMAQPTVPSTRSERERILLALAGAHELQPIVKLRGGRGDTQTHDEPYPYEALWDDLVSGGRVDAARVEFVCGPLDPVLDRARCIVTVSSTAALEAIARRVPVMLLDDFGIGPELVNEVFVGSGCFGTLDDLASWEPRFPGQVWREANYFHETADDDWLSVLLDLVERPRRRLPLRVRYLMSALRRTVRLALHCWSPRSGE